MKIVLLDADYNIRHEFDDVQHRKRPKKLNRYVLTYKDKTYTHHDTQEGPGEDDPTIYTFVEAEVLALNVTLGGRE